MMHKNWDSVIASPIGWIGIKIQGDKLSGITFLPVTDSLVPPKDPLTHHVVNELEHYFQNPTHAFAIDFLLSGTTFQQNVWQALREIPCGETRSYGELAKQLNSHPRAIGQACKTNPIPIIVPCHRIVAMHDLGGFAGKRQGPMMDAKKWLLAHERNT